MEKNQKQELSELIDMHLEKSNTLNILLMKKMKLIIANEKNEQLLNLDQNISELSMKLLKSVHFLLTIYIL
jgi:hypothetical protein